jgi:hypothetical protein
VKKKRKEKEGTGRERHNKTLSNSRELAIFSSSMSTSSDLFVFTPVSRYFFKMKDGAGKDGAR